MVVRQALFITKEKTFGEFAQFDGVFLRKGDSLELTGYYWSNFLNGGQYMVFKIKSGKEVGNEIGIYTREEYKWLVNIEVLDWSIEAKVHCNGCGAYCFSVSLLEFKAEKLDGYRCGDCR